MFVFRSIGASQFLRVFQELSGKKTLQFASIMGSRITQYCAGGKTEKNEMGGACGTYGEGERCA